MRSFKTGAIIATTLACSGCVTLQALEPVVEPPAEYRSDKAVDVEFLPALAVGLRCAERGARFMGLPGINSSACADAKLITMLDPCATVTAGPYAEALCAARRSLRTAAPLQYSADTTEVQHIAVVAFTEAPTGPNESVGQRVYFVHPGRLKSECGKSSIQLPSEPSRRYCVSGGTILLANPCSTPEPRWYERTLCHELAHANGWPADHSEIEFGKFLPPASESPEAKLLARRPEPSDVRLNGSR